MRDPRYWQSGHPEREAYPGWVGGAWRNLNEGAGSDGLVWVKPYSRRHGGETHEVAGHFRQSGGAGTEAARMVAEAPGGSVAEAPGGSVAEAPGGSVEQRYTVRDASGGLMAVRRCGPMAGRFPFWRCPVAASSRSNWSSATGKSPRWRRPE